MTHEFRWVVVVALTANGIVHLIPHARLIRAGSNLFDVGDILRLLPRPPIQKHVGDRRERALAALIKCAVTIIFRPLRGRRRLAASIDLDSPGEENRPCTASR
jgi:hypothetical protein